MISFYLVSCRLINRFSIFRYYRLQTSGLFDVWQKECYDAFDLKDDNNVNNSDGKTNPFTLEQLYQFFILYIQCILIAIIVR
ncbi:hypothetical protein BLA29_000141 [Euroglyphus maynei]|uniref:Uncharacterized protein n=1 Tax=Euroglyphus maynei TaxID=6958 RepID=A0A1Y3BW40_EURMA|nr:hypothetical protein BLA29_000141 [Euroglyphus maynei]